MSLYSLDLRTRIVDAYLEGEGSQQEIAAHFKVSRSTVQNYLRLYEETGDLTPKNQHIGRKSAISSEQLPLLQELVEKQSDATLTELCRVFEKETGITVGSTSMWRALNRLGLTFKPLPARSW